MSICFEPRCSFCQEAIPLGAVYWYCNGATICQACFGHYAQNAFEPYRLIYGQEGCV